jgi:putative tryptophan/tyrosine transport system substrate-binding protein
VDRRRFLLTSLAGALAAPLDAGAQVRGRVPRIGILAGGDSPVQRAFHARFAELGYREGHNVEILRHYHGGTPARAAALAGDLVALKPDVIVAVAPPSAYAVQKLTTTIPIVFYVVGRPVEGGLITNLARPGGNITGISLDVSAEFNAKQLQLVRELLQGRQGLRLAMLWNPDMRGIAEYVQETERAAGAMGIKLQSTPVRDAAELELAVSEAAKQGNHGLVVLQDVMMFFQRQRLAALAATNRLPAIYPWREAVDDGGLMSYGVHQQSLAHRAADYVDKILKGARPSDLPVEQPTKFEFVINLKTAKALGLTIPPSLLARADQVIE